MNKILTIAALLALSYTANAQNVGVGTNQPNARLHVAGVIKTDSALVVQPISKAAANSISIGHNDGFVNITNTSSAQSNAISMSGTPRAGQWLGISNQDDDDATFASTTIPSGTVALFVYDGVAWKLSQNSSGSSSTPLDSLTDADGDTKIKVEATPDEDLIKLIVPEGIYPAEWTFSYNNLTPPSQYLISIGRDAGKNLTGDEFATILIGEEAGENLTDEVTSVVAIGNSALKSAGEVRFNTAIGSGSLENATGNYNTAFGASAGQGGANFSGRHNTFIGSHAGLNADGRDNVMLGTFSGYNATGSGNVFLGYHAGYSDTTDNKLYIENSNSSSPLIYGEFDSNLVRINGTFDINNAYHFPLADGSNGQVLSTDGLGNVSWINASGGGTLDSLTDADGDTKIKVEATPDEDLIKLIVPEGIYPAEWTFSYNNLTPPSQYLISIGRDAGKNLTGDEFATILIGDDAGENLTDEVISVVAIGNSALKSAGEVQFNTAIGTASLRNATGNHNTALGASAGQGGTNFSGLHNTFIGSHAGLNAAGSDNVMLGTFSGYNATGSGNVFLGYHAGYSDTTDNKLYIENSNSSSPLIYGEFDSNLVRINGTFDINNAYHFPLVDGSNGQVLSTDGSGSVSWINASGGGTLDSLTDADGDTKILVEESADEDLIRFDLGGTEKWVMTGNRIEPTSDNTLIGQDVGAAITTGTGNTAYGANALKTNTTANNNAAFGFNALLSATTGQYNGAYGTNAGYSLTTGDQNVFVGNSAGYSNSTGSDNTFIGQFAGYNNTGSGNVFIGRNAGGNETGSNKLYIANSNSSSPLIYGEFNNSLLEINGDLQPGSNNTYDLGSSSNRWTAVYATNGTIQTSDRRFKDSIADMGYGLNELMALRSVTYQWKEDTLGETKLGFIAQELEQIVPEVVNVANDSMQTRGVNYAELIPVLVKAIQEQQKIIEDCELEIKNSKLKIDSAQVINTSQNQRLADLEAKLQLLLNSTSAAQ